MNRIRLSSSGVIPAPSPDAPAGEEAYTIRPHRLVSLIGVGFFGIWVLLLAFMVIFSEKPDLASAVCAWLFLAFGIAVTVWVFLSQTLISFTADDRTVTYHPIFGAPRTWFIQDITEIVTRRGRGTTDYRFYIGKKRIFRMDSTMVNADRFLERAERCGIPVRTRLL